MHIQLLTAFLGMFCLMVLLGVYFFDEISDFFKPTLKSALNQKMSNSWFKDYETNLYYIINNASLSQPRIGELMAVHNLLFDDDLMSKKTFNSKTTKLVSEYVSNIHETRCDISNHRKIEDIIVDSVRLNKFLSKQSIK